MGHAQQVPRTTTKLWPGQKQTFSGQSIYPLSKSPAWHVTIDTFRVRNRSYTSSGANQPGKPQVTVFTDTARLMATLLNGTRIYGLPQDNMPCVVTGKSGYVIPNPLPKAKIGTIEHKVIPGKIPNPAKPLVIPSPRKNDQPSL